MGGAAGRVQARAHRCPGMCDARPVIAADSLFPARDDPDAGQAAAVAAVCARLGRPRESLDADGYTHTIVGGALAGDRVAWVEQRWQDHGYEDIEEYTLFMWGGDQPRRAWIVDTYNPWFGCEVLHLRWIGPEVTMIYAEKHHTIACVLAPGGAPRLRAIDSHWQVVDDVVFHASESRGLVERLTLPALLRCAPLSVADAAGALAEGTCEPPPPLPDDPAALRRQICARLPAISGPTAELLVGALAYRFWDQHPPLSGSYAEAYAHSGGRWNPPCWLPFYWHHTRPPSEAERLLAELDAVAARLPAVHDDTEAVAELAARHIAVRCGELATACRAGHLPEGTACYFWFERSQAAFAAAQSLFPPGMWAVWTELRPRASELRALGERPRSSHSIG